MLAHEFIIVSEIPDKISFCDYDRSVMTVISDEFILDNHVPIRKVKMHCSYIGNIIDGLSYHGVTILDVAMSKNLKAELLPFIHENDDCAKLINLLDRAISQDSYIIHFGI